MLPNLVILGAQKSATSFVQNCLAQHPDAYLHKAEVPFFEDPTYGDGDPSRLERLLPAGRQPKIFGIKRPDYLTRPEVPERVAKHLPDAMLLAVLRDPIGRAVSAYYHLMRYRFLPLRPLNEGMRAILDGRHPEHFTPAGSVLQYGCYGSGLARWVQHFPRGQLLVLLREDIRSDMEQAYQRILDFLGLPQPPNPPDFSRRDNQGVYSLGRQRFLRAVQRVSNRVEPDANRWGYRGGPFGMGVYFLARQVDKRLLAPVWEKGPESLDPDLRERLQQYYRPEVERLAGFLGRDLSAWLEDPGS